MRTGHVLAVDSEGPRAGDAAAVTSSWPESVSSVFVALGVGRDLDPVDAEGSGTRKLAPDEMERAARAGALDLPDVELAVAQPQVACTFAGVAFACRRTSASLAARSQLRYA